MTYYSSRDALRKGMGHKGVVCVQGAKIEMDQDKKGPGGRAFCYKLRYTKSDGSAQKLTLCAVDEKSYCEWKTVLKEVRQIYQLHLLKK